MYAYGDCSDVDVAAGSDGDHRNACTKLHSEGGGGPEVTLCYSYCRTAGRESDRGVTTAGLRMMPYIAWSRDRKTHTPYPRRSTRETTFWETHGGSSKAGADGQEVMRVMRLQVRGHCDGHMGTTAAASRLDKDQVMV